MLCSPPLRDDVRGGRKPSALYAGSHARIPFSLGAPRQFSASLLEQIRIVGQSVSAADQDALRGRIAAAENLLREATSPPVQVDLTRDTVGRGDRRTLSQSVVDRFRITDQPELCV